MKNARQSLGRWGEALAAQVLRARGYALVAHNWRCQAGEIDLIAQDEGVWVFIEVRTRRGTTHGIPEETITSTKRERLMATAMAYLAEHDLNDVDWRIDVVAIEVSRGGIAQRVTIIPNAVQAW